MIEEKTAKEMIYETNRDVKWICKMLQEMKETDDDLEQRVRALEGWQSQKIGEELKVKGISAAIGAGAGGLTTLVLKFFLNRGW
ncbi:hypothetical protein [Methanocalculus sp.]|uniref:hypothetical protein n=1 Tax=Methanocalculus sp. TaxID=2004547 RepID=UPI002614C6D2|nr:hypothetical protein [Methanocalculus sp.]MDG6249871.1 hypothetical protein [Methanocalculus sp.]